MEKIYAYIDESGSYGFDFEKEGNQNLFIVSAIIVKESDILQIEKGTERIRKEEFNGTEIKSNGIKGNHKRRKRVLGKALNLPFYIFALVVNKKIIFSDHGIKKSKKYFYEFLNNLLYKELRAAYPSLSIIADEPIQLQCAGRTDAGVNATGQVVHFDVTKERPDRGWVMGTNGNLPNDIAVTWAKHVDDSFHARFSAKARRYRYIIQNTIKMITN